MAKTKKKKNDQFAEHRAILIDLMLMMFKIELLEHKNGKSPLAPTWSTTEYVYFHGVMKDAA